MAKKIPKKKSKDNKEHKENIMKIKKKRQLVNIALTILLFLIVLSSIAVLLRNKIELPFFNSISSMFAKEKEYAAIVNKEPITLLELDERYDQIPDEYRFYVSKEDLLNQMIDETLLLKKAEEMGVEVTDEEVESYISNMTAEAGITVEEFESLLLQNSLTLDDARVVYKRSLILNKAITLLVFDGLKVINIDIEDYYYSNPELFISLESIDVSHILICHEESERCVSNLTKEEALKRAEEIISMVREDNFGELAVEYSDEPAAQTTFGSLGWIDREMPFDKDFLDAAFSLETGEVSEPIETIFGYHIIKVFERVPEQVLELDVVYDSINYTLMSELQYQSYMDYLEQLREESEIIYFQID